MRPRNQFFIRALVCLIFLLIHSIVGVEAVFYAGSFSLCNIFVPVVPAVTGTFIIASVRFLHKIPRYRPELFLSVAMYYLSLIWCAVITHAYLLLITAPLTGCGLFLCNVLSPVGFLYVLHKSENNDSAARQ